MYKTCMKKTLEQMEICTNFMERRIQYIFNLSILLRLNYKLIQVKLQKNLGKKILKIIQEISRIIKENLKNKDKSQDWGGGGEAISLTRYQTIP